MPPSAPSDRGKPDGGTMRTKKGEVLVARPARLPYNPKVAAPRAYTRPFFRDPAHTLPVKWGLYRPLLRAMGGAAALAAARAAGAGVEALSGTSSSPSPSTPATSTSSSSSSSSSPSPSPADPPPSSTSTPSPSPSASASPSRATIPASRVLRGSSYLAAFQGTEHVPARKMPPTPAYDGFAPLAPLSGTYPHLLASLRARWRTARGWTSMGDTRAFLKAEEGLLGMLEDAGAGAEPVPAKADAPNASSMSVPASSSLSPADPTALLRAREAALAASYAAFLALPLPPPTPRPLLTGGYMRPTKYSPPLPRMMPQPRAISGMFARRQRKREARILKLREVAESRRDISAEVRFWRELGVEDEWTWTPPKGDRRDAGWTPVLDAYSRDVEGRLYADIRRSQAVYEPEMIERVKEARRRRDTWRVNRARKRRGEEPVFPPRSAEEEAVRVERRAERERRMAEAAARGGGETKP